MECPVARNARLSPDAPALIFRGQVFSWRVFDAQVRKWHARLARASGVARARGAASPGIAGRAEHRSEARLRCVWAIGAATPDTVALIHAAGRARIALALLHPRLSAAEREVLVAKLGPVLSVANLADGPATSASDAGPGPATRSASGGTRGPDASLSPDEVQLLLFTSGTTGVPKAAQLTAGALQASARAANEVLGIDAFARVLCCMPLSHVGGAGLALRAAIAGATLELHERFDAAAVARALAEGTTHLSLVANTLARLLDEPGPRWTTVRAVQAGGGPVPSHLLEQARARGLPVLHTYGLTETCSGVTCERLGEADGLTAGPPMRGAEIRIEGGEIFVRGPMVMRGYLGEPPVDGWLQTGDLGELDARGRLVVHARRTDLILSGGENVYPAEIEAALLLHPDVVEAAVVPMPDERWGQRPCAFVAVGKHLDAPALAGFLRDRLASFKVPDDFRKLKTLPRTAAGKVDRAELTRRALTRQR